MREISGISSFVRENPAQNERVGRYDIKELFSKQPRYPNLSKLALACVVLPNSNADSEHIFSMLNKIQTEQQGWQKSGKYSYFPGRREILGNKIDS
jgi:hypothetical protein